MKEKIKITRKDLADFYRFTCKNGIILNCNEIYNDSIYLDSTPCNRFGWSAEKEFTSDEVLKLVVKILNVLVLSEHELIFKEEEK